MSRPKLLDLFCCAGGAARGYDEAGFDVFGVDIVEQSNYPYPMIVGGGEGGIRTLDGVSAHTPLAGECLQPLGHLSVENPLRRMILDHPAR